MKTTVIDSKFYVEVDKDNADGVAIYYELYAPIKIELEYYFHEGYVYIHGWEYTDVNAEVPTCDEDDLIEWCKDEICAHFKGCGYIVEFND